MKFFAAIIFGLALAAFSAAIVSDLRGMPESAHLAEPPALPADPAAPSLASLPNTQIRPGSPAVAAMPLPLALPDQTMPAAIPDPQTETPATAAGPRILRGGSAFGSETDDGAKRLTARSN